MAYVELNENSKPVSRELLEEWLLDLAVRNSKRIASASVLDFQWSSDVVEFIFNACNFLKAGKNVKYIAVEIFEKFVASHVMELFQCVKKSRNSACPLKWQDIEDRISQQSVLRVMTAIQLASKLESHYRHLTPMSVSNFLAKSGKSYSLGGILNSEFRVMRTLKYSLNITTRALYLEMLLYILFVNDPRIDRTLETAAFKILDIVYIYRKQVYNHLYENITGRKPNFCNETEEAFLRIKADFMLLSTAIIGATAFLIFKKHFETIVEQLHQVTRILRRDIRNFSLVIVDVINMLLVE